jgi:hypothetical protein
MSLRTASEKLARAIGEELGMGDDVAQADLLNGFFETFAHSMREPFARDTQVASVTYRLSESSKKLLRRFAEFCEEDG